MKEIYFETIKCYNYDIYNLTYHINRISNTIGLNINLQEYIYPPNKSLLKCKVIYDKNGILNILYSPYKKRLINTFKLIYDDNIIYNKKSTNRKLIDNLFFKKGLSDEIIIIKNNLITDTSIANIAIFYNNQWITPKSPLLHGTSLQRHLNNDKIIQKDISVKMLKDAKKIALLNAMIDFDIIDNYILNHPIKNSLNE